MANMALKEEYQLKLIHEGGVRRLNQLGLKRESNSDIKFFVALGLARIAKNPDARSAAPPRPAPPRARRLTRPGRGVGNCCSRRASTRTPTRRRSAASSRSRSRRR